VDLLITDVMLPDMRGTDLAAALKTKRAGLRVLFISGYTEGETIVRPDAEFLGKPFGPEELKRKVREALDAGSAAAIRKAGNATRVAAEIKKPN